MHGRPGPSPPYRVTFQFHAITCMTLQMDIDYTYTHTHTHTHTKTKQTCECVSKVTCTQQHNDWTGMTQFELSLIPNREQANARARLSQDA